MRHVRIRINDHELQVLREDVEHIIEMTVERIIRDILENLDISIDLRTGKVKITLKRKVL